jgi:hypothetical protein
MHKIRICKQTVRLRADKTGKELSIIYNIHFSIARRRVPERHTRVPILASHIGNIVPVPFRTSHFRTFRRLRTSAAYSSEIVTLLEAKLMHKIRTANLQR